MGQKFTTQISSALLSLYPDDFQAQFADDTLADFSDLLQSTAAAGPATRFQLIVHEFFYLSQAIFQQHLQEQKILPKTARMPVVGNWQPIRSTV